jgi:hypothetical protein
MFSVAPRARVGLETVALVTQAAGPGVGVGGTGVAVGGFGVLVGGTGVAVGGFGVLVGAGRVAVGLGCPVLPGRTTAPAA